MTLKQFLYVAIFCAIGYIVYSIIPVAILNVVVGVLVSAIGLLFAFLPINDRTLDVWIKNLIRRMNSPTQYLYKKKNESVYFIKDLFFISDPHLAVAHVESKAKLAQYLREKNQAENKAAKEEDKQKSHINDLLKQNLKVPDLSKIQIGQGQKPQDIPEEQIIQQPFLTGVVKNRKQIPLPGILVSIKDLSDKQLRLLKTNPYGVFATYSPLPQDEYMFEIEDPNGNYFFDTMKISLQQKQAHPLMFYSKEVV